MLRKKDAETVRPWIKLKLFIATSLLLAFFFLLYYGAKKDENGEKNIHLIWIGFVFLGSATLLTFIISISNFVSRPEDDFTFEIQVQKRLN